MTIETLQLTFGAIMDGAAFLAIFVYMPVVNWYERHKERKRVNSAEHRCYMQEIKKIYADHWDLENY